MNFFSQEMYSDKLNDVITNECHFKIRLFKSLYIKIITCPHSKTRCDRTLSKVNKLDV